MIALMIVCAIAFVIGVALLVALVAVDEPGPRTSNTEWRYGHEYRRRPRCRR